MQSQTIAVCCSLCEEFYHVPRAEITCVTFYCDACFLKKWFGNDEDVKDDALHGLSATLDIMLVELTTFGNENDIGEDELDLEIAA
jgi:hypothetical protein